MLRALAVILAVALIQPAIGAGKASAAGDQAWSANAPDLDKYEDGYQGYKDGDPSFSPGMIYVGYYTDGTKDLTSKAAIRFALPPRPVGAVIKSATLTVDIKYRSTDPQMIGNPFFKVYGASDDNWSETGTDLPAYDPVANYIGESGDIPNAVVPPFTFDVKNFLNAEWQGTTSAASFVFTGTTAANVMSTGVEADASVGFYDRNAPNHAADAPKLQIVYAFNNPPSDVTLTGNTVAENQPTGTVIGTLSGTDPDGDTLTYSITAGDTSKFKIVGNQLQTAAPLDFEAQSSYPLTIAAADPGGASIAKNFTVSVTDVNEPPADITLTNASIAENESAGTAIGQLAAVGDPDQTKGPYTYSIDSGLDESSFKIVGTELQSSASFDYETKKQYQVNVKVTDVSASFTKTFTIAVSDVNEAPTNLTLSGTTVAENKPADTVVGTLSAVDPDAGDTFTYEITGGADASSFGIAGDKLVTKAPFDYETAKAGYEVKVQAKDQDGLPYEKTFEITVTDANDAPTDISLAGDTVDENKPAGTFVGTLSTVDPDTGDTFTYAIAGGQDASKFQISGSSLQTKAPLDYETQSSYEVKIQVTDSAANSFNKTFTITAQDVNEAPTDIALSPTDVDEDLPAGTTVGTLSAADPDAGDTFQYAIVGTNDNFEIDGDLLKTKAEFDKENKNAYSIEIQVTDRGGLSYTKTITVAIGDVNEKPTDLTLSNADVDENQPAGTEVGQLAAVDPDAGDTFTYAIDDASGTLPFAIAGDTLSTTDVLDYETQDSYEVPVKVTDSGGLTCSKTFDIRVQDVNDAPTDIALAPASVAEGQPAGTKLGTLSVTDQDSGGTYSYSILPGPDAGNFTVSGSDLLTNAELDYETRTSYSIDVRVTDGAQSYVKTLTIAVSDVNEAPIALKLSDWAIDENRPAGTVIGTLTATDPDTGDDFVYSISGGADAASFSIDGNELRAAAAFDYETKQAYDVRVKATDRGGLSYEQSFVISVNDVNDVPTAISIDQDAIDENQPAGTTIGTLGASDQDAGDSFTYEIAGGADASGFSIDGATLKSAAAFDYETKNVLSVAVKVTDAAGASFTQTLSIKVRNVNDAPVASDQSIETRGNRPIEGQLVAKDPDHDTLTYAIVDQPPKGDLTLDTATGKFTFKPKAGNYDALTFTFKASDGRLDSNVATVTVTNLVETGGGGGGGGGTPPKKPDVSVDGLGGIGGVNATYDSQDPGRIHISFDRNSLQSLPAGMKTFSLHLNDQLKGADIAIDPWLLDQLKDRDIALSVQTSFGVLSLPKSAWALAGGDTLTVSLESAPDAEAKGLHVIGNPVSVRLEKGSDPLTAPLDAGFLTLQLPSSGNRPTTAVRLANGGYRPVPSLIGKDDDGYTVQLSSRVGGTFALVSAQTSFSDTSGWSQPYIDQLASRLVVNGVGGGKFEPARGVTRAEFAKIVVQALDLNSVSPGAGFQDTDPSAWYADSVGTAVELGLFTGYPDGTFHPAQTISREEAFAVLSRALKLAGLDDSFSDEEKAASLSAYSDAANLQDWAQQALAIGHLLGLVHDDGAEFRPTAPMTREQLCYSVIQLLRAGGLIEQD